MQIEVQFWGVTERLAGGPSRRIVLPERATVADAVAALAQDRGLAGELARCAYAVGDDMVDLQHPLRDGDQVAVLPPVSGG